MTDKKKNDPLQFDKRVMHRFVQNHKMTAAEVQQHLTKLPDLESQSEDIASRIFTEKKGHGSR
ncbi:MAG: hypothetical protein V4534_02005 [Myxococcota bacterium]